MPSDNCVMSDHCHPAKHSCMQDMPTFFQRKIFKTQISDITSGSTFRRQFWSLTVYRTNTIELEYIT